MTATITLTETSKPSTSKGRGWLYAGTARTFATPSGRSLDAEAGDTITVVIGVELRRASGRVEKERREHSLTVTGVATDTVEIRLGSPQAYAVLISGVTEAR